MNLVILYDYIRETPYDYRIQIKTLSSIWGMMYATLFQIVQKKIIGRKMMKQIKQNVKNL